MARRKKQKTRVIEAGRKRAWTQGLVSPPVHHASTILFETYRDLRKAVKRAFDGALLYGRLGTPSQWALEEAVAELEGAAGAKVYPSGMAAVALSVLALTKAGDHVLFSDQVYEPTRKLAQNLLPRFGIETDFYDPLIGGDIKKLFKKNTRAVFVETPGSLTFEVPDLPAIARAAKQRDALVFVDNTWATPLFHNALAHGADVSIHAATKYIVGHSDVMLGIALANKNVLGRLKKTAFQLGQTAGPDDCFLTLRGLRTLEVRLRQHQRTALEIATWLAGHPLVETVLHPALPSCSGHEVWKRDFTGSSGLFSFQLKKGSYEKIGALTDGMAHFRLGFSWGGFESLILPQDPAPLRTATKWQAKGPLVRLHVGLEDVADLKADLAAALKRFEKAL